jgi:hypothetical protein
LLKFKSFSQKISPTLPGLESIGGNRVFSDTRWHNLLPAGSLVTLMVSDGPFKLCRVAEKPAAKRFTALIFWFFWIKPKEQTESSRCIGCLVYKKVQICFIQSCMEVFIDFLSYKND